MANNFSDQFEKVLINTIFRGVPYVMPTTLAVALSHDIPTDASTPASMNEISNAGAYARQTLNPATANWSLDSSTTGTTWNNSAIAFPTATADWGFVSGVLICDQSSYGQGSGLFWGSLTTAKLIQNGDSLTIPVSGVSIQFD